MTVAPRRRYAILAEGRLQDAKTAHGVLRYGSDEVVAVLDSTLANGMLKTRIRPAAGRSGPSTTAQRQD